MSSRNSTLLDPLETKRLKKIPLQHSVRSRKQLTKLRQRNKVGLNKVAALQPVEAPSVATMMARRAR